MEYRKAIVSALTYMDAHFREAVTASQVAEYLGYSERHFCRMFTAVMGITVGAYLRAKRLECASAAITCGCSVTEAASDCGFDTPSGFNKAFRKRYGMSPTEYKNRKGGIMMTPEIKKMAAFTAVGYYLKAPENLDILDAGAYWLGKDFSAVSKEDYQKLTTPGYAEIGAWMHPDNVSGDFYYFFGPMTKDKSFVPNGMIAIDVPEAEYAVFLVPSGKNVEEINQNVRKTWKYIFSEWFDQSDYKFDEEKMDFELYRGEDTFIYVPVLRK